MWLIYKYVTSA